MKKNATVTILGIIFLLLPLGNIFADSPSDINSNEMAGTHKEKRLVRVAEADTGAKSSDDVMMDDLEEFEEPNVSIADPFEPINRVFFHFNDKLYFWVLKPVARGYKAVVPQPVRKGVKNFFNNLAFPIRFVNNVLQFKFEGAGYEVERFLINSTLGLAGFMDRAADQFDMKEYNEDLGQTLGSYGIGRGFYIDWPFLGPSSVTDTIGYVGDIFLDPVYYADLQTKYELAVKGYDRVNETSFRIGEYEDFKKSALDPYVALRNAYFQHRQSEIKK